MINLFLFNGIPSEVVISVIVLIIVAVLFKFIKIEK